MVLQYYRIFSKAAGFRSSEVVNRVRFVFFGAEEAGLLGSFAYVKLANDSNAVTHDLDRLVGMFDFDMFGTAPRQ
jgi:Zn-dependent M28 family amino/carboxypeptidase